MKLYKRIAALGTAALLSLSLTACGDTSWVYKAEDDTISSGVYLGYLTQAYLNGQSEEGFDPKIKNIWKQKIDKMSYKEYCIDKAEKDSRRHLIINEKFDEMKLKLTEEDQKNIESQVSFMWDMYGYQNYFQPNGTSKESFEKIITTTNKEKAIFDAYYAEGGLEEVSKDTLKKELLDNYADINYFEMSFEGKEEGSVLSSSEIEKLKEKAEGYAERINKGENSFNEVKTEYQDEVAKESAKEDEKDFKPTKKEDIKKDTDTKQLLPKEGSSMSEKFVKAVFDDIKTDKATVITVDTSYYVVVKYDIKDDMENNMKNTSDAILSNLKGEEFEKMVQGWIKDLKVEENSASLHKYSPKNIEIAEPEQ